MPDSVTVRTNLPDFRRQMKDLSLRVERRVTVRAVRAAGIVFRQAARAIAPVLKAPGRGRIAGALAKAIYIRAKRSTPGVVQVSVGVKSSVSFGRGASKRSADPFYWRFLEGGWIPRGPGQRFRGGKNSRALARYRALRAGGRRIAYPFLAPAFERNKQQAVQAFIATMDAGIEQEARNVR